MHSSEARTRALEIARRSVEHAARTGSALQVDVGTEPAELRGDGASFVTIMRRGELRGCTGMVQATKPLARDIADNAATAALRDPRFSPITLDELPELDVSVSVLTPMQRMSVSSRDELVAELVPDVDGLLLVDGSSRGLLLPQVWESLPKAESFVSGVLRKAGLPTDHWSPSLQAFRFQAQKID